MKQNFINVFKHLILAQNKMLDVNKNQNKAIFIYVVR